MGLKSKRGWFLASIVALGVAGWAWALTLHFSGERTDGQTDVDPAGTRADSPRRARHPTSSSLGARMTTVRSARLLAEFDEIADAAVGDGPNEKLLAACRNALLDPDHNRRSRDFALLIELMRPQDGVALHEAFLEMHRHGRGFVTEYAAFATRWGELDPVGALDYLATQVPMKLPTPDFQNIVRGWAQSDPEAALRWVQGNPDLADSRNGLSAVLNGWMRIDPEGATDYLLNEVVPPNQMIDSIRYGAVEKQFSTGPQEASRWIASLPDEGLHATAASMAWDATAYNYSELNYETAAEIWGHVGSEPWMDFGRFERFSSTLANARANRDGEAGFVEALQQTWPVEQAAGQFVRWHQQDPEAVSDWLERMPSSGYTDRIRAALNDASNGAAAPAPDFQDPR